MYISIINQLYVSRLLCHFIEYLLVCPVQLAVAGTLTPKMKLNKSNNDKLPPKCAVLIYQQKPVKNVLAKKK